MNLFLERPLVVFDLETTGVDVAKDRIVSIAGKVFSGDAPETNHTFEYLINPGMPIPKAASDVHGITDEMVKNAPKFEQVAGEILARFSGADLAGFNLINFDVPMLWEEFARADTTWNLDGIQIVDAGNIFKKKEPRTLSAGVKFYCGREHADAHNALADVEATAAVLFAQMDIYDDLAKMNLPKLAEFSRMDNRIDLAGKFVRNEAGEAVYNFGKHKGARVSDDPSFAAWMRGKDFTANTLMHVESILGELRGAK